MTTEPQIVTNTQNQNEDLSRFSVENLTYTEKLLREAKAEILSLHDKLKELLTDNALLDKANTELKTRLADCSVIKLPLRRVNSFLMLTPISDLSNDDSVFYVKIENGEMARIFRNET